MQAGAAGERMHDLVRRLFPICRSITGEGLRATLSEISRSVPLTIEEVPTGTPVLDWHVPREWNIRAARIETLSGEVLVDFDRSNLHVVSYSIPVDRVVSREELARHVHTVPERPDVIPYRTGYYADTWGFCLPHRLWTSMQEPSYRVIVDSDLTDGSLSYGELLIEGREPEELLISVHCCHPSLANDNLSGIAVATEFANCLRSRENRLSYRILFIPATIGSLTWLARNEGTLPRIRHGLVLTCLGDPGSFHYKRSRRGDAMVDRAAVHVLSQRDVSHAIMPFSPLGYDERQYCSPGFDLPVGCLMRSPNGMFPQYHTSEDNPDFVTATALAESLSVLLQIAGLLDRNQVYTRADGRGEPQLGRRGLYRAISGQEDHQRAQTALMWFLNLADGRHTLLDMAARSGMSFDELASAASLAKDAGLVQVVRS